MATAWQTLEEAALTLGISSRTLHRRISKGECETRMQNGRREVLVIIPDPEALNEADMSDEVRAELSAFASRASALAQEAAAEAADTADEGSELSDSYGDGSAGGGDPVQTTMIALHEDRIRRTDLAIMAYQQSVNVAAADSRRAHRNARVAWSLVGVVVSGIFVAGLWATHTVTKVEAEVGHLQQVVRQLTDTADAKSREADKLRQEAEAAKLASAKVEGELSATKGQLTQLMQMQATAAAAHQAAMTAAPAQLPATSVVPSAMPANPQVGVNTLSAPAAAVSAPTSSLSVPATQPSANGQGPAAIGNLMQRITLR